VPPWSCSTSSSDPEFTAFYRSLERKAHEKLESWCEELRKQGLSPRARVCVGRRGAEILRRAQQTPCDLIMMASHSITGPEGRLGTLSHQVAMLAACSVLLVRSAAPPGSMTAQAAESRNPST
jgi:nucleotide-binding universal stress UspA family protein